MMTFWSFWVNNVNIVNIDIKVIKDIKVRIDSNDFYSVATVAITPAISPRASMRPWKE